MTQTDNTWKPRTTAFLAILRVGESGTGTDSPPQSNTGVHDCRRHIPEPRVAREFSEEPIWTAERQALWQRLLEHDFGTTGCALTFQARLAREHGWSEAQAAAAILEYKRFCFLAMHSGHAVSPSESVDEVWHLHLTYSRDYWSRFCPQVLGGSLHHEPTRGGRDESRKHYRQYADTLASYQHFFGAPPQAWWPDARGYAAAPRFRLMDRSRHWLLPRPRLTRLHAAQALLAAALLLTAPWLGALPLNPLDLPGPPFLLLYGMLFVAALVTCLAIRRSQRSGGKPPGVAPDAWSIAYLAGGTPRVVDAGVATLLADGKAEWQKGELHIHNKTELRVPPLAEIARASGTGRHVRDLVSAVEPFAQRLHADLVRRGLLLDEATRRSAGLYGALPFLLLAGLGLAKIVVGLQRDRPVVFLVFLVLITATAALVAWRARPRRSANGEALLRSLNQQHAHARLAPRDGDVGLAVALGGTAILAGTAYAGYHDYRAPQSSSSSGCSTSSCSSGDSGGGDSGGGGCGGCGGGGD